QTRVVSESFAAEIFRGISNIIEYNLEYAQFARQEFKFFEILSIFLRRDYRSSLTRKLLIAISRVLTSYITGLSYIDKGFYCHLLDTHNTQKGITSTSISSITAVVAP